jgi:hypothetical protein
MPEIQKLYVVKFRPDFYKDDPNYTKYFLDEIKMSEYIDQICSVVWKVPSFVIIEELLAVIDNDKVFAIDCYIE